MVLRTHLDDILVATISGIIRSCLWVPQDPVVSYSVFSLPFDFLLNQCVIDPAEQRRYHHDVVIHELHCPKLSEKGGV